MILRDVIRSLPSGAPIAPGTEVRIYRERDNALLGTVVTDANGMFSFEVAGNPGALRYEANVGAGSKIHSTRSILPVADLDLSGVRPVLSTFLDGVVVNYRDALEVVSDGLSMKVTVGAGVAVARGVIYRQETTEDIAIPAAVGNPRIDVIAIRFWLDESGNDAGRCELVHKQGTAAVTPVAPALEQTSSIWETPLAEVRVDPSVIGIAQGKVKDTRLVSIPFIPDGTITREQLDPEMVLGMEQVIVDKVLKGTNVERLHFDSPGFGSIWWEADRQVDLFLNFAGSGDTFRPAHSNHSHNLPVMDDKLIAGRTISANVDGQDAVTIPFVEAIPHRVRVRLFLRVSSQTGGATDGTVWVNIHGEKGAAMPYQSDGGVDSLVMATHTFTTGFAASTTASWGITVGGGNLLVTGGWLEWEAHPNR